MKLNGIIYTLYTFFFANFGKIHCPGSTVWGPLVMFVSDTYKNWNWLLKECGSSYLGDDGTIVSSTEVNCTRDTDTCSMRVVFNSGVNDFADITFVNISVSSLSSIFQLRVPFQSFFSKSEMPPYQLKWLFCPFYFLNSTKRTRTRDMTTNERLNWQLYNVFVLCRPIPQIRAVIIKDRTTRSKC